MTMDAGIVLGGTWYTYAHCLSQSCPFPIWDAHCGMSLYTTGS